MHFLHCLRCVQFRGRSSTFGFVRAGDDDETPFTTSKELDKLEEGALADQKLPGTYFSPRHPPQNLLLIDEMDSLCPVTDMKVADLTREGTAQIYTLCGQG